MRAKDGRLYIRCLVAIQIGPRPFRPQNVLMVAPITNRRAMEEVKLEADLVRTRGIGAPERPTMLKLAWVPAVWDYRDKSGRVKIVPRPFASGLDMWGWRYLKRLPLR